MKRAPGVVHVNRQHELPEVTDMPCCMGAAVYGPGGCACWEPIHDLDQRSPVPGPVLDRPTMCGDCAFRPGSPERAGMERAGHDQEDLDHLTHGGGTFWCPLTDAPGWPLYVARPRGSPRARRTPRRLRRLLVALHRLPLAPHPNGDPMTTETWARGDWMQTFTGRRFYPLDPRPDDIDIHDIAQGLSHLCRFAGQVDRFYTVAEHSLLLSYAVAPELALDALLHDAAEAYIVDVPRPLKRHLPDYVAIEDQVLHAIAVALGLWRAPHSTAQYRIPAEVKAADTRILHDERAALMRNAGPGWDIDNLEPLGVNVVGHPPTVARALWLGRYRELAAAGA